MPNDSGKYLAIEVRDETKHQVSFFILAIENQQWLWEEVSFEEQWWINLQAFSGDEIQFVYYEDGNSPENKQTLNINIDTKKVLEEKVTLVNPSSRAIVTPPLHYLESSTHFNTVSNFLKEKFNISPIKGVDYIETQQVIVISYYIWKDDQLANFLLIMDQDGSIRSHELLADKLSAIGIDTFFILGSSLFTIRQKEELLKYDI